jgi:rare lipoprotein A (peptidoglycan hydrolase)
VSTRCNGFPGTIYPDVRLPRVVACAALIAALASVVVPGSAGSRTPSVPGTIDPSNFRGVELGQSLTTMTAPTLDQATQSDGRLGAESVLREPQPATGAAAARPMPALRASKPIVVDTWTYDPNISWYGPGFYGNGGACGMLGPEGLTRETIGVAHRTLPCGTRVTFRYNGRTVTTMVIDRGPYVAGRTWDMTRGLCEALGHCFTGGGVYYRIG